MSYIREEHGVKYFGYDIDEYPFVDLVSKAFKVDNLQNLHDLLSDTEQDRINKRLVPNEKDAHSDLHQIFYEKLNQGWPELIDTYESFIEGIIAPIFKTENIIFQSKPTFRIQFPNNIAVGGNAGDKKGQYGWHRDTDPGYDHPNNEKNFIIYTLIQIFGGLVAIIAVHCQLSLDPPAIIAVCNPKSMKMLTLT